MSRIDCRCSASSEQLQLLTSFFRVAVEMAKGCLQAASWLIFEASDTSPDPFEKCVSADEMVIERNPYVKRQQSSRG